jgi:membrane fusion protein, multidrug efflux system
MWPYLAFIFAVAVGFATWMLIPPTVRVAHPRRGPAVEAVYATGSVEATVMLPVATRTTARMVQLNVDEPSQVKKGQILAKLEDDDLVNDLLQLRAQEAFAKAEYDRDERLVAMGGIAVSTFQRAKSDWEAAKAATARAVAQVSFMTLVAPADGQVIRRDGEIGQLIPAGQPVFWITDNSPLRISAEVDEEDIAKVEPKQKVYIRSDAFAGQVFDGEVLSVTPKGDAIARSYRVRIALPKDTRLKIGMTAEANIVLHENKNALLVPTGAVDGGGVWTVEDGRLSRRPVSMGAKGPKETEIVSGIADEALVVLTPSAWLQPGQKVRTALQSPAS